MTEVTGREPTAFVREVVLPGLGNVEPNINPDKCFFDLEYRPSPIHRWGIFAAEPIPSHRRVIEYTGQRINEAEVWRRSIRQHLYVFWLNDRWALDGAFGGSGAEFINHSCSPNLVANINKNRIYLSSVRPVNCGEELTLDYNMSESDYMIKCECHSSACREFIGA